MSKTGEPNIAHPKIAHLLDALKNTHNLTNKTEADLMQALWDLRGAHSLDEMATWTNWSRQTIYNKWAKHGISQKDAQPTGD